MTGTGVMAAPGLLDQMRKEKGMCQHKYLVEGGDISQQRVPLDTNAAVRLDIGDTYLEVRPTKDGAGFEVTLGDPGRFELLIRPVVANVVHVRATRKPE